ncbi:hypothetical protein SSBR45G_40500 [Bradyrhizobium sp. SSBR45G]|uniref:WG repeat-containing protein n=1 Tax=unclassified Bradyrhizobium TaxID=2631580 RepID=UPI002342A3E9|nr:MULTISPECIES: WG repeat-containing protein [unclassified Bradyrhizobium]GLH79141.1 hypothetical protein SSBR45G_40500 [Bradyrhizobium sp. SSBR45G]GLH84576.1 hypothetical protein SSBR45R_20360 [Bradyrhizobium sp. SSBR45R]
MMGMGICHMLHGSFVAQRCWPSATRAAAALLTFAASLVASTFPTVAADHAEHGPAVPYDCWEPGATVKGCAVLAEDGQIHLSPSFRKSLRFGPDGLTPVLLLGRTKGEAVRWLYVHRDGAMAAVMAYDNGAEEFTNGRARSPVGAKIGYIDPSLKLVIPAIYDGAYPFEKGVAVVCLGCSLVSEGEHSWFEGGTWGCIDPDGRTVAPFRVRERPAFSDICRP